MARMIPQLNEEQLKAFPSRAEARFYQACRDRLPEDIVVIYSANWIYRDPRGRINEGEADFTVLSPRGGVLAVEVKGGGVSFDAATGAWHSVDRNGKRNTIKDPFKQASKERHALLDQITGHASWRQWTGARLTIGHAVMLPDIGDPTPLLGPDRQREIVGTNADIQNVARWHDYVMRFWRQSNDDPLGAKGIRLIEDILCRSIEVRPILRAAVDDTEEQRIRLTANQAKVFRTIGGRRRAVVSGGAGTGKTVLAVEKAKALANAGLRVMLLCYNRPLADSLAIGLRDEPLIRAQSYHQLCDQRIREANQKGHDILKDAIEAYPGMDTQHRFDVQMPYALALSADVLEERFDALVVDEAQDFSDEYWLGLEMLLRDQENSHLFIFIDENQALYPRKAKLPVEDEPFYLTNNCRNTAPIHEAGYSFYKGVTIDPPELLGQDVIWTGLDKVEAQADAVAKRVHQWLHVEGLKPEEVAVLVAKRPKGRLYELLTERKAAAEAEWAFEAHGRGRCVLVDTVARFKGLEAHAVILWVGDEIADDAQWETLYVGTTRAKSLLSIVGSTKVVRALRAHPK
ncbi:MAG: ATP-binding domain-containing protein [Zoogloeaceae bacterium]|nr:ATP-binding domain-containing protein [Zoogloeaceae bacterium]